MLRNQAASATRHARGRAGFAVPSIVPANAAQCSTAAACAVVCRCRRPVLARPDARRCESVELSWCVWMGAVRRGKRCVSCAHQPLLARRRARAPQCTAADSELEGADIGMHCQHALDAPFSSGNACALASSPALRRMGFPLMPTKPIIGLVTSGGKPLADNEPRAYPPRRNTAQIMHSETAPVPSARRMGASSLWGLGMNMCPLFFWPRRGGVDVCHM